MSTFLELCQRTAQSSGTVSGNQPLTVTGQVGRLGRIVGWVQDAYTEIQNLHGAWLWMKAEFEEPLTIGQRSYEGSDFGLTRVDHFLLMEGGKRLISIYDSAIGVSDEGFLSPMDWPAFYSGFLVGGNRSQTGKPSHVAISPDGKLWLFPTPDKAYELHGFYRKTPQELTADADVPEMPARFHDLIKWQALIYLGEYDESATQLPLWMNNRMRVLSQLERNQLPEVTGPETLA
jgi:hypothetical protein